MVDRNWWMSFNAWWKDKVLNQNETIDIKDHNKAIGKKHVDNNPSNNRLRDLLSGKEFDDIDDNDISHTSTTDKYMTFIIMFLAVYFIVKLFKVVIF